MESRGHSRLDRELGRGGVMVTANLLLPARHVDDTTKPSRLNRRRKKRWKIAGLIAHGLTDCVRVSTIESANNKLARTITPVRQGVKRLTTAFFYVPRKVTALVRLFFMVACRGPLSSGPEPCPGGDNPLHAAAQRLSPFGGGHSYSRQGITA